MFQVICIDDTNWGGKHCPVFGHTYTVIETTMTPHKGKPYYYHHLKEFNPSWGFRVEKFALVSTISETTFEREYNKQKV